MNYRCLTIVGWVAVLLGIFSIIPFVVMGLVAIPKVKPSRWLVVNLRNVDWNLYLNTLLESQLLGLDKYTCWRDIAKLIGGVWLRWWIQGAAAVSNMGMFVAEMSSDSFQLLGMAERGMLPKFFGNKRSRHGTPVIGILFSASGVLFLSWLSFQEIVAAENLLYCFGMILEFISFIRLRVKYPATSRPYKIPFGTVEAILMCIPPTVLICVVLALSTLRVVIVSLVAILISLVMLPCLTYVERKRWIKFTVSADLPDLHGANQESVGSIKL
ncbi:hypothetical protein FF1_037384 [Malus domestica]